MVNERYDIPHEAHFMLTKQPSHKNRHRFSLIVIDANGIQMKGQHPIVLCHNGLQNNNGEQANTFNLVFNNEDD